MASEANCRSVLAVRALVVGHVAPELLPLGLLRVLKAEPPCWPLSPQKVPETCVSYFFWLRSCEDGKRRPSVPVSCDIPPSCWASQFWEPPTLCGGGEEGVGTKELGAAAQAAPTLLGLTVTLFPSLRDAMPLPESLHLAPWTDLPLRRASGLVVMAADGSLRCSASPGWGSGSCALLWGWVGW